MGNDEPILAVKRVLEKVIERHQKKLKWPEEYGEAHRGKAASDEQGEQAHRGREGGGDAGKDLSTERNVESCFRGNQESPSGSGAGGRVDGQEQEPCLVPGELRERAKIIPHRNEMLEQRHTQRRRRSPSGFWNRKESRWNFLSKEENPRGGRERIHQERHQDVRRGHGRIGWLLVIVKVQSWILQALSKWDSIAAREQDGTVRKYDRLCDSTC